MSKKKIKLLGYRDSNCFYCRMKGECRIIEDDGEILHLHKECYDVIYGGGEDVN